MNHTVEKLKCDGDCHPHEGEVIPVFVQKWGVLHYCAAAIAEDRRRGLVVTDNREEEDHATHS